MHMTRVAYTALLCFVFVITLASRSTAGEQTRATRQATPLDRKTQDHARYIIKIAGCNDCHTTGYAEAAGKIPETDWLKGDTMGWRGPWGTTYASNLRLSMHNLSEEQWVRIARSVEFRPPMPWFVLREMKERDLRAIYRFIRHLGPAGDPAPAYVPPDQKPRQPFILFPESSQ
jgi:hypothetical protein